MRLPPELKHTDADSTSTASVDAHSETHSSPSFWQRLLLHVKHIDQLWEPSVIFLRGFPVSSDQVGSCSRPGLSLRRPPPALVCIRNVLSVFQTLFCRAVLSYAFNAFLMDSCTLSMG